MLAACAFALVLGCAVACVIGGGKRAWRRPGSGRVSPGDVKTAQPATHRARA